ncbi:N-6 DNA methylase [Leptolyngbya sp. AN03gr2]|uniref:type I restriction-modification system subunit M n=1 Tax=unclassified Leptolyngbya TaxID=2650499 RepID=UPI003D31DAD8
MLTDPELRSKVDQIWDRLWSSGLSNPMDSIEQFSYLLFLKRLDDAETKREKQSLRRKEEFKPMIPQGVRWSEWVQLQAGEALKQVRERVFPWLREMGAEGTSFQEYMRNAEFKISKPNTLIEVCNLIDEMKIAEQNQDVQGDLYEYLLNKLSISGRNGQFRTPRHIIRMMVELIDPKPTERVGDLAAGTCGFLVNAYEYILEQYTSPEILYDEKGYQHLVGDRLSENEREFLQTEAFTAYDNDSGMTMLRIGSMNLMLHGIRQPRFFYKDTLSKGFDDERSLDVVLMNPPFKGKMDESDVHEKLPAKVKKTELLFLHLILRVLDMGGRCAVIVPDGVLFGSSKAHVEIRKRIIEENRLDGIVSMPSGVFKPYAGVSTAVLLFTRGATTDRIWFYDIEHDGFSLDDKRQPVAENDIPDILGCWKRRFDAGFVAQRAERIGELKTLLAPLKAKRLALEADIHRLTFEAAIAPEEDETARQALETEEQQIALLKEQIAPLQSEVNQLNRQFWVTKDQVKANKYDLSASRYRQIEQDEVYYESPKVTMERLLKLEHTMAIEVAELEKLME